MPEEPKKIDDLIDVGDADEKATEIDLDKKEQKNDGTVISIKPQGSPKT